MSDNENVVFAAKPQAGDPQVGDRAILVDRHYDGRVTITINCEWATTEGWIELDFEGARKLIEILQRVTK